MEFTPNAAPARAADDSYAMRGGLFLRVGERWSLRYEPRDGEQTAWRRPAVQLDGRAFLGGPAYIQRSRED